LVKKHKRDHASVIALTRRKKPPGQAQAEATKEAQRAGFEHAKDREAAYRGRKPSFTAEQLATVRDMMASGSTIGAIAKATGLPCQAIYRIQAEQAWAEQLLAAAEEAR
jgi:putative DNA-invertase from lambdoid prophage Rac